ncbi:MAG: efflux RND transporter periplasmic adaptor subunit, partial [Chitinophagales bacterium]|nr:efflux RND transporter periplasmic adaptor subunit [Chitinophagales bacterium]
MKNYNIYIVASVALIIGFAAAWFFKPAGEMKTSKMVSESETIWTCSMHPQIRQNEPGLCPICAMDLIPLEEEMSSEEGQFSMTEEAVKLADIRTMVVGSGSGSQTGQKLNGQIQADETRSANLVAHIGGRIEHLYISFTGEEVRRGQKIADIYSPELVAAQKELLELQKFENSNPAIFNSAKQKLKNWKFTDAQINEVLERGTVVETFPIYADHSGVVQSKDVNSGDYVRAGQVLFRVQDLSRLWVLFDVYESDLAGVKLNDKVKFTTSAMPSKAFEAKVKFVDPSVNAKTRVAKIRAEIDNSGGKLKPGMFVKGELMSGNVSKAEIFLPETAILWTGERSVVYVKTEAEVPTYEFREVVIGNSTTNGYFIKEGITIGDEVVVNGAFVIDAAAQLNNNKSMMNRDISV